MHHRFYTYVEYDHEQFFTICLLPEAEGRFPIVVYRSPYVKPTVDQPEDALVQAYYDSGKHWLDRGYAMVFQHCRGQGKSTGAFVPYVHEREDGLAFREWIRRQPFYNGELYLMGGSYTASLHYATAPFESDIRGAVLEVQDSQRYRLWYRGGQMRKGHANWHFGLFHDKINGNKNFSMKSFSELPLAGLSGRVLGETAADFEEMLEAASPDHPFWSTRNGGSDTADAVSHANIPILLTTGYNDFYVGGVFDMWRRMDGQTREKSALLVSPYDHGDGYHGEWGVSFPCGRRAEAFGWDYPIAWFDHIRKGTPLPFATGVVTYYRAFEEGWRSDFYGTATDRLTVPLGSGTASFVYDPLRPPAFRPEGQTAEDLGDREDVVCLRTPAFEADTFVRGQMQAVLAVSSTAPDTSFYVRISLCKPDLTYVLRHDITSLCHQLGDYGENSEAVLTFRFDEYAFRIRKGECLQVEIAATDDNTYVCHTNRKGPYARQEGADRAENRVYRDRSYLILPVE